MAEIIIIAAVAENNVIGNSGKIPWHIKEDFLHFKELTTGYPCIMGRKTYDSLPHKPLEGRENIVLTSKKDYAPEGVTVFNEFRDALIHVEKNDKAFICGGANVYELALKIADTLELTRIHQSPEGDTFFPEINYDEWKLVSKDEFDGYSFMRYERKEIIKNKV